MTERSPIDLHGARTGNCIRVAIAFEEAGLPYRLVRINMAEGEHRGEAHREINPAGKVPTIVDHAVGGGRLVLSQSNAIMLYAARQAPGKLLPELDARAYAVALERFFYFITDVIAVSHSSFMLRFSENTSACEVLDDRVLATIGEAERFLDDGDYLAGGTFTLADVCAVSIIRSVHRSVDWKAVPRLARWYERTIVRPSVVRGIAAF